MGRGDEVAQWPPDGLGPDIKGYNHFRKLKDQQKTRRGWISWKESLDCTGAKRREPKFIILGVCKGRSSAHRSWTSSHKGHVAIYAIPRLHHEQN